MALTATQQAQVRHYLGVPDDLKEAWIGFYSQLTTLSAEGQVIVSDLLDKLQAIDDQLEQAPSRLKAWKVGSIELPHFEEIQGLRSEGRRLVGRLCAVFGLSEPYADVYGEGGSAMGGAIPLG